MFRNWKWQKVKDDADDAGIMAIALVIMFSACMLWILGAFIIGFAIDAVLYQLIGTKPVFYGLCSMAGLMSFMLWGFAYIAKQVDQS